MTGRIRACKALGQNFLVDRHVLARIAAAVAVQADDSILEIGPGQGALTRLLVPGAARLVAVELDRRLAPLLADEFADQQKVEIIEADILDVDLVELLGSRADRPWKVAANLPYNISSQVLIKFLETPRLFSRLVLMLQKEVGDRLVAPPDCKEYGILSVFCRLHFDIVREFVVRPGAFQPIPKVDSVVLRFTPLPAPRADVGDERFFRQLVKAAFNQRRKTLWNCLKGLDSSLSPDQLREAMAASCIDGGRRGETLSLEEFASLSRAMLAARRSE
ncbi:MAG TPA: 16S rRNA (adenine(1518)-N(6)/adenine(1519)-N(6))-dimethyltransferase RsmA [Geobacteraceae bacterium]